MYKQVSSTSTITIKTYINLLDDAAKGKLIKLDKLEGEKKRAAKELLKEGLISNNRLKLGHINFVESITITPSGCTALISFKQLLKDSSFTHKIIKNLFRLLWIIVGALVASLPKIMDTIFA